MAGELVAVYGDGVLGFLALDRLFLIAEGSQLTLVVAQLDVFLGIQGFQVLPGAPALRRDRV